MKTFFSLLILLGFLSGCNSNLGKVTYKNGALDPRSFLPGLTPTFTVSDVSEGNGLAVTFSLPKILSSSTTFSWVITGDDPIGDFPLAAGSITLGAGNDSGVIIIPTNENLIYDQNRNYQLSIRADVPDAVGTLDGFRVLDDESVPVVQFTAPSQNVNENAVLPVSSLSMSPASKFPVSVAFAVSGTASGIGVDHSLTSGSVSIPAGSTSASIPLMLVDDVIAESGETVILTLGTVTGTASIGVNSTHTATIVDNENVNLSINDVSVAEGGTATFTVSISSVNAVDVTFDWATADGSGNSTNDYFSDSGTGVTIPAGSLSTTVSVATRSDAFVCEVDNTFSVNISNVTNSAVTDATGVGTITDPDVPDVQFLSATGSDTEGSATDTVTNVSAILSGACATHDVTFDISSTGVTATSNVDFTSIPTTTYTVPSGSTSVNIPVTFKKDDLFEADETLTLTMSNAAGASLGAVATHTLTISNDDQKPTLSIADLSVTEGTGAGTTTATATVTLSAVSGVVTQVDFATSDGSATAADYTSTSGTVTIPAGSLTGTFSVTISRDATDEFDQTIKLKLSGGNGNYKIVGSNLLAELTILDDDLPPVISIAATTPAVEGDGVLWSVTLAAASEKIVSFDLATSNGTAIAGSDYTSHVSSYTIAIGSTTRTVGTTTTDDAVNCELTENFTLAISNIVNATAGTITRTQDIQENDIPVLSLNNDSVTEGGSASITMTSSIACPVTVITAKYSTFSSTALETQDFPFAEGTFTIPATTLTSNTVSFSTVDDGIPELEEIFFVGIGNPNVGSINNNSIITIADNEGTTGPARVAVSNAHSCALSNTGDLKCWGASYRGTIAHQTLVGDAPGETEVLSTPVPIPGPYSKLAVGENQACVLLSSGGVRCWGDNVAGSLGFGEGKNIVTPASIASLANINFGAGRTGADVCVGGNFQCVLLDNQTVKCWGYSPGNGSAAFTGYNAADLSGTATLLNLGGDSASSISCGTNHACVVTTAGGIRCWGANSSGQLGNNSTASSAPSVPVNLGTGLTAISVKAGDQYTCAILRDSIPQDRVKCWGLGASGRTGQGTTQNLGDGLDQFAMPADEMGDNLPFLNFGAVPDLTSIHTSSEVTCAGFADGSYRCWGLGNYHGGGATTLGDNPGELATIVPLNFGVNTVIEDLTSKYRGFCGLVRNTITLEKSVRCFGSNADSALGANVNPGSVSMRTTAASATAVAFDPAFTVTAVPKAYGNNEFNCALGTNGVTEEIRCWGRNGQGQTGGGNFALGDEASDMGASLPILDPGLDGGTPVNLVDVKLGAFHTCVLTDTGKVKCIGNNSRGQLGDGTTNDWGDNLRNDGSPETLANQVFVTLPRPAVSIDAGSDVTCAITDLGDLYCWGYHGGHSNNSSTISTPVKVDLGTNLKAAAIEVASSQLCVLLTSQAVKCWGTNQSFLLGIQGLASTVTLGRNPGEIAAISPIDFGAIGGIPYRVKSIFTGDAFNSQVCAILHDDSAKCWGYDGYGPLGINMAVAYNSASNLATFPLVQLAEPLLAFIPGYWTNCAITKDFRFKCWGGVFQGENPLGTSYVIGNNIANPIQPIPYADFGLDGSSNPKKLWAWAGSGPNSRYCAVVDPGELKCWGSNLYGAQGYGDEITRGDDPGETPNTFPAVDLDF